MQRYSISVSSITYAINGRDILRKVGIKAYVERKTNVNGNVGCGYVIIAQGNKNKITQALIDSGVKILDFRSIA